MRFLKTADGVYLNVTQIGSLYPNTYGSQKADILAHMVDAKSEILVCDNFPDKDAAQRYLWRIVSALTHTGKNVIEVKNYEAD